ncbi:OLC1v1037079C1 [Oldenlandia corymbosa var. corymbosa]|uniref:OLC1v1037079C1 n=1 Tax=Oldenlandia corymbosa var. corymbosa TaxID=529605 RepID=A0AAV1CWW4_OLDCO|nr:OLC1v1037079C1 [Oldenlandia corymbosa var. corymbosa]
MINQGTSRPAGCSSLPDDGSIKYTGTPWDPEAMEESVTGRPIVLVPLEEALKNLPPYVTANRPWPGTAAICSDFTRASGGGGISVEEALQFMTHTLYSREEVGLIAGWDDTIDGPVLYRMDGMQGVIKGEILATGLGFRRLYGLLDLRSLIGSRKHFPGNSPSWLDNVLDDLSQYEKYRAWSVWGVDEATKMAMKAISYKCH